jgi:hypothetical protein
MRIERNDFMRVRIFRVSIPAMSTIGFGFGTAIETGEEIRFCGDHRPLRDLGEALRSASEPLQAEVESWQIL